MAYKLADLGNLFRNQLYAILTGGDGTVPPARNSFITWCMPGLPYEPEDFRFAAEGIASGANVAEQRLLLQQAYNFASLIDYIPEVTSAYSTDRQEGVWRNASGARLSEIYGQILKFSLVIDDQLTEEQQKRLDRMRGLLRVTKTVKDVITEEEKQVTEDSPMQKAYKAGMQAYTQAAMLYNAKRTAAQTATGEAGMQAVADWSNNAELYRMQVAAAMDDWTTSGYKNEVEQIHAYIDQTTEKSMLLWKRNLESFYDLGTLTGASGPGQRFFYTTVVPGDFATASGWTEYTVYHSQVDSHQHSENTSWSAGGGFGFGFWKASAGVRQDSQEYDSNYAVDDFSMTFKLAQVQIVRPWFYPEFLENRGWDLRKGHGWNYDQMPSDGGTPPQGRFIGYPLQALFVKDVSIRSASFASALHTYASSFSASASVGFGPFSARGSYSHQESDRRYHFESDGTTITIPGMQIIGFVNHLLGKTPNLLDGIDPGSLV
ncbi:MAG TPA: hypothetical protein VIU15_29670 [Streptomyces sp.]